MARMEVRDVQTENPTAESLKGSFKISGFVAFQLRLF